MSMFPTSQGSLLARSDPPTARRLLGSVDRSHALLRTPLDPELSPPTDAESLLSPSGPLVDRLWPGSAGRGDALPRTPPASRLGFPMCAEHLPSTAHRSHVHHLVFVYKGHAGVDRVQIA